MFNKNKIEIGDILLFKSSGLIGKGIDLLTFNKGFCHVAIYVGGGDVIEAHLWSGVSQRKLKESEYGNIVVYRYYKGLNQWDKVNLVSWLESKVGLKYGLIDFPATFIHSVVGGLFKLKWLKNMKPIFNSKKSWFCSELAACAYDAIKKDIDYDIYCQNMQPNDFPVAPMIKFVC